MRNEHQYLPNVVILFSLDIIFSQLTTKWTFGLFNQSPVMHDEWHVIAFVSCTIYRGRMKYTDLILCWLFVS